MCTFAVGAYLLLAVDAYRAIGLLRANVAPLHDLAACWVWKFACYLYVKFQEPLQGHVCRETLHSLVGDPVFCTAFWALYLQQYSATIVNMRRTAGYTWTDYKRKAQIAKELKITQILDKLLEYKISWIQHVNRMPRNGLPKVIKYYSPTGRRNHGRPLKRLLDT